MKKNIYIALLIFSLFFITGCEEIPTIKVIGTKNVEESGIEEVTYEWNEDNPNLMVKKTTVYTYKSSNYIYDTKAIECESYKKQGSLYYCEVTRGDGKVKYRLVDDHDVEETAENVKNALINDGYTIK
ncbi:MAG: hypothetical protein IJ568_06075 [Bacilli bacterium]|nr:hypothetical protein [Bacilli bacterium]